MRAIHPLREILDAALLKDEPLLDTEWPAHDVLLLQQDAKRERAPAMAPLVAPTIRPRP